MRLSLFLAPARWFVALACLASCARFASPSPSDARDDDASAADVMVPQDAPTDAAIAPWSRAFTDGLDLIGLDMAVSRRGQIAVVGAFRQTVDFGLGPIATQSPYNRELFVVLFDANGRAIWNRSLGGTFTLGDYQPCVTFADEDVVVAGSFESTHPLDVGHGPLVAPGHATVFATRFDATGRDVWTQLFGDENGLYVLDLATNTSGEVFLVGRYYGTAQLGPWTINGGTEAADNTFLLKLGADGTPLASASIPVTGVSYSRLAVSPAGDISVIGALFGTANFGVASVTITGGYGLFAAGFDSSLRPTFAHAIGTKPDAVEETLFDMAADAQGNVLIAAWSTGPIDLGGESLFSNGAYGSYVLKLDTHGNRIWDHALGPTMTSLRVAIDAASDIRITGPVRGPLDLGLGALSGPDAGSILVLAAYSASGAIETNRVINYDPYPSAFIGFAAPSNTDVVFMGGLNGTVDFGSGSLRNGPHSDDMLIARIRFPGGP